MSGVPEPTATAELTIFDALSANVSFGTGWLVQGEIDLLKLGQALSRVVNKWRLFAGRLQRERDTWVVKIPLGHLPSNYALYSLTDSTSDKPLSAYISLPLPTVSPVLPPELYMPPFLPTSNEEYMNRSHPIVSFHVVRFATETSSSESISCLGLTLPHGIVDGVGATYLCRAIVAELNNSDWKVPALPREGFNKNVVQDVLQSQEFERKVLPMELKPTRPDSNSVATSGSEPQKEIRTGRTVIIPTRIWKSFVEDLRRGISGTDQYPHEVTMGDILVAWILKVMYNCDPSPTKMIMMQSLASFRHLFPSLSAYMTDSPHNYLALLPIPLLPVSYIQDSTFSDLALLLSRCRHAFCEYDVSLFFKQLTGVVPMILPTSDPLNEPVPLVISNASKWRLIETDWSEIGVKATICGYRMLHGYDRAGKDAIQMIGRLNDGSVVLDTILSELQAKRFGEEVERLIVTYSNKTDIVVA